jgi:hypothetical protein
MRRVTLNNGTIIHLIDSVDEMLAEDYIKFNQMVIHEAVAGKGKIADNIGNAINLLSLKKLEEAGKCLFDAYQSCRAAMSDFDGNHRALALCIKELKNVKDGEEVMRAFYKLGLTQGEVETLVEDVKKKFKKV